MSCVSSWLILLLRFACCRTFAVLLPAGALPLAPPLDGTRTLASSILRSWRRAISICARIPRSRLALWRLMYDLATSLASSAVARALCASAVTVMNWLFSAAFAFALPRAAGRLPARRSRRLTSGTTIALISWAWLPIFAVELRFEVRSPVAASSAAAPRYT